MHNSGLKLIKGKPSLCERCAWHVMDVWHYGTARAASQSGADRALAALAKKCNGTAFQLPYAHTKKTLGGKLGIWLPGRAFGDMIASWARDGSGKIWDISQYFVGSADWTGIRIDFLPFVEYKDMKALAELGGDFRQSAQYQFHIDRILRNTPTVTNGVPLATIEDVDDYFGRYLRLITSIREQGMLRQEELEKAPDFDPHSRLGEKIRVRRVRDISVAIDANGEILRLQKAYHRSAAAMILDIPRVPVEIRLVHRDWLKKALEKHPDEKPSHAIGLELDALATMNALKQRFVP